MESKKLPIGTKVFDIRLGWGEVAKLIENSDYPIYVEFPNADNADYYTTNGKFLEDDLTPMLSLTEYNLVSGGFTPITEFDPNAPKVGDVGYFYDNEEQTFMSYSKIKQVKPFFISENDTSWDCFSKEIPQWFKDKMNENG